MPYHLEMGGRDQQGWLYATQDYTADGDLVVLLKPNTALDEGKIELLRDMFGPSDIFEVGKKLTEADLKRLAGSCPAAGTG
ncbi:hypothetical protein [Amycolatopsis sp. NPDC004079]|uniref:hypothetical protein n=1 Tax=Amycolatopsis sp. NPDC004079 TaxID=3154549 RepID=UPI0033BDDDE4